MHHGIVTRKYYTVIKMNTLITSISNNMIIFLKCWAKEDRQKSLYFMTSFIASFKPGSGNVNGWGSEQSFSWWDRETMGFRVQVVFYPLIYCLIWEVVTWLFTLLKKIAEILSYNLCTFLCVYYILIKNNSL